ncbi:hypothetical protein G6L37_34720 [Agrobacterium rubi]|nr:hypothetical protein [Agrobacterium rubi]NTF23722.1 hypothetical protein [Agrobacterium rubi]
MIEQISAAVKSALENDLPEREDEVWAIVNDRPTMTGKIMRRPMPHEIEVYSFPQTWGSTAGGFGGVGGQMMTTLQTVIVSFEGTALVYFGSSLAYRIEDWHRNDVFVDDMRSHVLAAQYRAGKRYRTTASQT